VARRYKRAFEKLCRNLKIPAVEGRCKAKKGTFVANIPLQEGGKKWEYCMEAEDT
jgi:hypothetical protein